MKMIRFSIEKSLKMGLVNRINALYLQSNNAIDRVSLESWQSGRMRQS